MINNFINRNRVLVLNRNWQAINITSPTEALSMMYVGNAKGLHVIDDHNMMPKDWDDWCDIPISKNSEFIKTVRNNILIPKIIIVCNFDKIPKKRLRFTIKNIWIRDRGICQYSGKILTSKTGNIDHIIPKSRGGVTSWKNCVLSHKEINDRKGDKTLEEAGLKLLKIPSEPREIPSTLLIKNTHKIKEWDIFLKMNNT